MKPLYNVIESVLSTNPSDLLGEAGLVGQRILAQKGKRTPEFTAELVNDKLTINFERYTGCRINAIAAKDLNIREIVLNDKCEYFNVGCAKWVNGLSITSPNGGPIASYEPKNQVFKNCNFTIGGSGSFGYNFEFDNCNYTCTHKKAGEHYQLSFDQNVSLKNCRFDGVNRIIIHETDDKLWKKIEGTGLIILAERYGRLASFQAINYMTKNESMDLDPIDILDWGSNRFNGLNRIMIEGKGYHGGQAAIIFMRNGDKPKADLGRSVQLKNGWVCYVSRDPRQRLSEI